MHVTVVTGNPVKAEWALKQCADYGITATVENLPLIEPQADTVAEVSLSKAKQAYAMVKSAVVVEDGGLVVPHLAGFPGPYSKYVLGTIGVAGILQLLRDYPAGAPERRAHFENVVTYIDDAGRVQQFVATDYKGTLATVVDTEATIKMWSDAWRVFVPDNFTIPMSQFTDADWERLYVVNNYTPVFTRFAAACGVKVAAE